MAGGDIRAGRAFVEMGLKDAAFTKSLLKVSRDLKAFGRAIGDIGKKLSLLGGAITAPMLGAAKSWATSGAELYRLSQRVGMSTEAISGLQYAAEQMGGSADAMGGAIEGLNANMAAAKQGSAGAHVAFARLGLSFGELQGLKPEEQFERIAEQIAKIKDPTIQADAATAALGGSAAQLLPMLRQGKAGIEAYRRQAEELGYIRTEEGVRSAFALDNAFKKVGGGLRIIRDAIGSALTPMLTKVGEWFATVARQAQKWIGENKDLVVTIFKIGVAVTAAGVAFMALGAAVTIIGGLFAGIAAAVTTISLGFAAIASIFAFILSPIGLIITGLGALVAWFFYTSDSANDMVNDVMSIWNDLKNETLDTFSAIADALKAGDIKSAMAVVSAYMKLQWLRVCNFFSSAWDEFRGYWNDAIDGIAIAFLRISAYLQTMWAGAVGFVSKLWLKWCNSEFIEGLASMLLSLAAFYNKYKMLVRIMSPAGAAALEAAGLGDVTDEDSAKAALKQDFKARRDSEPEDLAKIDADTARKKQDIEATRAAAEDTIASDVAKNARERAERQKAREAEVEAAKVNLKTAQTAAHESAAKIRADNERNRQSPSLAPNGGDGISGLASQTKISGTFSGLAAGLQGAASGPLQQIAQRAKAQIEAIDKQTQVLKKIEERLSVA